MSKDDGVPLETHEEQLTEEEKYKKARTQAKKDKIKCHFRKNFKKQTKQNIEEEHMMQTGQEQRDNLAFPSELAGGASSSQGPLPPKQPKEPQTPRRTRSRSRDKEPKTPKSEMKSESEATPKAKKEPTEKITRVKT